MPDTFFSLNSSLAKNFVDDLIDLLFLCLVACLVAYLDDLVFLLDKLDDRIICAVCEIVSLPPLRVCFFSIRLLVFIINISIDKYTLCFDFYMTGL